MKLRTRACSILVLTGCLGLKAQDAGAPRGPDPREIPIPRIDTKMGTLRGVTALPVRKDLPDVMVMNDGTKVITPRQWEKRKEEMRRILAYYAVGQMPPAPGNVKGQETKSESVSDGSVKYRLIHLTFGPAEKLGLDIGIFTPVHGGPFPAIILQSGTVPGASTLPRLPPGPNQGRGEDVLLMVGPAPAAEVRPAGIAGGRGPAAPQTAEALAS